MAVVFSKKYKVVGGEHECVGAVDFGDQAGQEWARNAVAHFGIAGFLREEADRSYESRFLSATPTIEQVDSWFSGFMQKQSPGVVTRVAAARKTHKEHIKYRLDQAKKVAVPLSGITITLVISLSTEGTLAPVAIPAFVLEAVELTRALHNAFRSISCTENAILYILHSYRYADLLGKQDVSEHVRAMESAAHALHAKRGYTHGKLDEIRAHVKHTMQPLLRKIHFHGHGKKIFDNAVVFTNSFQDSLHVPNGSPQHLRELIDQHREQLNGAVDSLNRYNKYFDNKWADRVAASDHEKIKSALEKFNIAVLKRVETKNILIENATEFQEHLNKVDVDMGGKYRTAEVLGSVTGQCTGVIIKSAPVVAALDEPIKALKEAVEPLFTFGADRAVDLMLA